MLKQIKKFSVFVKEFVKEISVFVAQSIGYGLAGAIILPLAAIVAIPQRIYHTCRRGKKPKVVKHLMDGNINKAAWFNTCQEDLNDFYDFDVERKEIQETRFLIQATTGMPVETLVYQNASILGPINIMFVGMYLIAVPHFTYDYFKNAINEPFLKGILGYMGSYTLSSFRLTPYYIFGSAFLMSAFNPRLVSANLHYLRDTFKGLLYLKVDNDLDRENRDYVKKHRILFTHDNFEKVKELVPFYPKHNLQIALNLKTNELQNIQQEIENTLEAILPKPIRKIIRDYACTDSLCFLYKDTSNYRSGATISIPPAVGTPSGVSIPPALTLEEATTEETTTEETTDITLSKRKQKPHIRI